MARLWVYQRGRGWYGHIDWQDNTPLQREGPFVTEAQAQIVISRMNGFEAPIDAIHQREWELQQANA